jgi:hypothetical protein
MDSPGKTKDPREVFTIVTGKLGLFLTSGQEGPVRRGSSVGSVDHNGNRRPFSG